ncbi:Fic family protein [Halomarina oriensis]|uniref:Fic family protein n=1 Tax=Halomarina oriensis TaxID=671145 RepID=A0A6B0GIK8_9EURY|nr:Fic family protein [Halomarina oriensis]MWG34712.1 Fic family protein [Halomarina oriensis]
MKDGYLIDSPAPGRYLPVDSSVSAPVSKFYLPDDLPPELTLSDEVVAAYGRAMHSLGRLDGFWSEIPNPDIVLGLFIYKEAEQSSQVEGTRVTVTDMYRQGISSKDVREARNYAEALREAVNRLTAEGRSRTNVTNELLKTVHERLMEDGRTDDEDLRPGQFRSGFAWIEEDTGSLGTQIRFVPPKAEVAVRKMEDFERYVRSVGRYPDLMDIAILHYQFETLHPFADGNGRVGRLLIVLLLIATDILVYPLFYLSSYINRNRSAYTDSLLAVNEDGAWNDWLLFFLDGIREQADDGFSRAKLLIGLRESYRSRFGDTSPSVRALADAVFVEPVFTVSRAAELIDMTYPAANKAIDELVSEGVLEETTGKQRYREFAAVDVLELLDRPSDDIPSPARLLSEK